MNIVIAGGTGLIGRRLLARATGEGHVVTVLTREVPLNTGSVRYMVWNGRDPSNWTRVVEEADAVVNLSGASIGDGRWTARRKQLIRSSRVEATRAIVDALRRSRDRPRVLVNASAVGYYGHVDEGIVAETAPPGSDFLAGVCREWEEEARRGEEAGARVLMMRSGVVLDPEGGVLAKLALPYRFFVGGPPGTGRQWLPWIHHDDMVGAILHAITTPSLDGPVNITSPQAVRMREFCNILGSVLRRPSWAPVPAFALKLVLGEMSGIVLTGQQAMPDKLIASGYRHRFAGLEEALREVLRR